MNRRLTKIERAFKKFKKLVKKTDYGDNDGDHVYEPKYLVASVLLHGSENWDAVVNCIHFKKYFSRFERNTLQNKIYYIRTNKKLPEILRDAEELLASKGLTPIFDLN